MIDDLRNRPIPDLADVRERRRDYRSYPIAAGPLSDEPLVELKTLGLRGENYYHRADNPPYYQSVPGSLPDLLLRESVAARLKAADAALRARNLCFFVHDAYRPLAIQRYFHDEWMPSRVRKQFPHFTPGEVAAEVEKYWAAPSSSAASPSPHSTGAAVDLTLCFLDTGRELFMGSIFDDVSVLAHTDFYERDCDERIYSNVEARANRRILYWVMTEAGFANHPNEWWHFSWGDQMWAKLNGEPAARYTLADRPDAKL